MTHAPSSATASLPNADTVAGVIAEVVASQQDATAPAMLRSALADASEPALIMEEASPRAAEFRIVWANHAFSELTGYEQDALLGDPFCLLQGPDTSSAVRAQLQTAQEEHEPVRVELTLYRADGQPYVSLVDLAPLPSDDETDARWLSFHHDVTAQRERENRLRYEATHDTLTGLANRAGLRETLQFLLETDPTDLAALLYLDLDRFKLVNDSLGHSKGDQLLARVGELLQEHLREDDTAARIGGDEFAVCLTSLDTAEQAHTLAQQIYETLNQPIQLDRRTVFTPASIGIVIGVSEYDTVEAVLRDADTAMYEAKDDANRAVAVYDQIMTQKVDEKLSLDTELRQGLDRNQFVPFFHPILDLSDGSLHGFEVLTRWQHPERGLLGPEVFLEAAEITGLIVPIGHQVIRAACQIARRLRKQRGYDFTFSLSANFSREEFFRVETHTLLTSLFEEYDLAPEHFTMEVSERTVADIPETDVSIFHALKDLGVDIILDDFGTGFSSLQSLRRLPVDGFKIDKGLLTEASGQAWDRDLIDLVIQMGHTLDQSVTAEGIETPSQLRALREMECSYGQGFLFARPIPAHEVEALVDDAPWTALWKT